MGGIIPKNTRQRENSHYACMGDDYPWN